MDQLNNMDRFNSGATEIVRFSGSVSFLYQRVSHREMNFRLQGNSGQDVKYFSSEYFSCDVVQNTTDKSIENHEIIHQVTSHDDRKRLSSERSTVETTRINHFQIKMKEYFLKITYAKYSDVSLVGY